LTRACENGRERNVKNCGKVATPESWGTLSRECSFWGVKGGGTTRKSHPEEPNRLEELLCGENNPNTVYTETGETTRKDEPTENKASEGSIKTRGSGRDFLCT